MPAARKSKRSRPRQSQLLEAAEELFIKHGYDKTSIEMIAEAAGIARQTVYNQFGSKEGLFLEITKGLAERVTASIAEPVDAGPDVQAVLERFAGEFVRLVLSPRATAIYRLVIAETPRFPKLGRVIYDEGVTRTDANLAALLSVQSELTVPDPVLAARHFIALTTHHLHLLAHLGIARAPSPALLRREVRTAVAAFLGMYGKRRR
jgi:AcrR family transcriptional regulator